MKNLFGGAVINYGPTFPYDVSTPDGSIFYKTEQTGEDYPGLYLYATIQDYVKDKPGDQTEQHWIPICSCGPTVEPPTQPPDTDGAICPITVNLPGSGTFSLSAGAVSVNITGAGSPGTPTTAGTPTVVIINGQTVSFPGAAAGDLTKPMPTLRVITISGSNRACQYTVPTGGNLSFCYNNEVIDPGDGDGGTFPITFCDGTIVGYGYGPGDKKDPLATVEVMDCDAVTHCWIYPDQSDDHNIKIDDCDGVITGWAFPPGFQPPEPPDQPHPNTDTAVCPDTVQLVGSGRFDLVDSAVSVNVTGAGGPGTLDAPGATTSFMVNDQPVFFDGSPKGILTKPTPTLKTIAISGTARSAQYVVPKDGSLTFCYNVDYTNPGEVYGGTFPIAFCDGTIVGYGFGPGDKKDPLATVEVMDCDAVTHCWIYPNQSDAHNVKIDDCDGTITGWAFPPVFKPLPPDTDNAVCPTTVNLSGDGSFNLPIAADIVNFYGNGAPGTATAKGADTTIKIRLGSSNSITTYAFAGSAKGDITAAAPTIKSFTGIGINRLVEYSVPIGATLTICHSKVDAPPPPPPPPPPPDAKDAVCPNVITLTGSGTFMFPEGAIAASLTGYGAPGTASIAGAPVNYMLNGVEFAFNGSARGTLTAPLPDTHVRNLVKRECKYTVPTGAYLDICYVKAIDVSKAECPTTVRMFGRGSFKLNTLGLYVDTFTVTAAGQSAFPLPTVRKGGDTTCQFYLTSTVDIEQFVGAPVGDYNTPAPRTVTRNAEASTAEVQFGFNIPTQGTPRGAFLEFCYSTVKPREDIFAAICPITATLTGKGKFILPKDATSITFYTIPVASYVQSNVNQPLGRLSMLPSKDAAGTTLKITDTRMTDGVWRYDIFPGEKVTFCYSTAGSPPPAPPAPAYQATFPISDCSGAVHGLAFGPTDKKDPLATVPITDCSGTTFGYIYPTSGTGHTTSIMHCNNTRVGYAVNPTLGTAGLNKLINAYGLASIASFDQSSNTGWNVGDLFTVYLDDPNAIAVKSFQNIGAGEVTRVSRPGGALEEVRQLTESRWTTTSGAAPNMSTGYNKGVGGSTGYFKWSGGVATPPVIVVE